MNGDAGLTAAQQTARHDLLIRRRLKLDPYQKCALINREAKPLGMGGRQPAIQRVTQRHCIAPSPTGQNLARDAAE